jgi:hypothetical protein
MEQGSLHRREVNIQLVIAWHHGEKGRQRVSGPEMVMVVGLLVIAGGILTRVGGPKAPSDPAEIADPPSSDEEGRPSIAVLPFESISRNPDHAWFADGMQGETTSRLAMISGLRVTGRSSVIQYRELPAPSFLSVPLLEVDPIWDPICDHPRLRALLET